MAKDEKKKNLAIEFFPMNYDVLFSYTKQDNWSKGSFSRNYINELM